MITFSAEKGLCPRYKDFYIKDRAAGTDVHGHDRYEYALFRALPWEEAKDGFASYTDAALWIVKKKLHHSPEDFAKRQDGAIRSHEDRLDALQFFLWENYSGQYSGGCNGDIRKEPREGIEWTGFQVYQDDGKLIVRRKGSGFAVYFVRYEDERLTVWCDTYLEALALAKETVARLEGEEKQQLQLFEI